MAKLPSPLEYARWNVNGLIRITRGAARKFAGEPKIRHTFKLVEDRLRLLKDDITGGERSLTRAHEYIFALRHRSSQQQSKKAFAKNEKDRERNRRIKNAFWALKPGLGGRGWRGSRRRGPRSRPSPARRQRGRPVRPRRPVKLQEPEVPRVEVTDVIREPNALSGRETPDRRNKISLIFWAGSRRLEEQL